WGGGTARSAGGGGAALARRRSRSDGGKDRRVDAVEILHDVERRDTEDAVALGAEEGVAARVVGKRRIGEMAGAVDLDNEPCTVRGEVGIVGAERHLAAEVMGPEGRRAEEG